MLRRFPSASEAPPPTDVQRAIADILALLRGEPRKLLHVKVDMAGVEAFHVRVYDIARMIPPGKTRTYGEIAKQLDVPRGAQAVGVALARNPFPIVVPCHRVLAAAGKLGGFSASGGVTTKRRLLEIEGVRLEQELTLFDVG